MGKILRKITISNILYLSLLVLVMGDLLGVMAYGAGVVWGRYLFFVLSMSLILHIVIKQHETKSKLLFQMLVFGFGLVLNIVCKPISEIENILYPFSFALFVTFATTCDLRISKSKVIAAGVIYIISSLLIDVVMFRQMIPDYFVQYYAHRGFEVDPQYILPGIHTRRFITEIIPFRFSGAVIDPLAHGIILAMISAWLFLKQRRIVSAYVLSLLLIFILTESRSAVIFGVGFLVLKSIQNISISNVSKNPIKLSLLLGVILLVWKFESGDSSHVRGLKMYDINLDVLFGTTSVWLTPKYVESGLLFFVSGFGVLAIVLLWAWVRWLYRCRLNDLRRALLVLVLMLPIHYYLFNVKILSSLLIFASEDDEKR